jgi:hypothetical protein
MIAVGVSCSRHARIVQRPVHAVQQGRGPRESRVAKLDVEVLYAPEIDAERGYFHARPPIRLTSSLHAEECSERNDFAY